MSNIDFTGMTKLLRQYGSDRALANSFFAREPEFVAAMDDLLALRTKTMSRDQIQFPEAAQITAIQTAIFDNWPEGRRVTGKPNRYGCAVEIWTAPASRINVKKRGNFQHKASALLMDKKELGKWLKRALNHNYPLSTTFLTDLDALREMQTEDHYVGVFVGGDTGTTYLDNQMIVVDMRDEVASLMLNGSVVHLPPFSKFGPDGKPHGGKVILQSRADFCGFSTGWATEVPSNEVAAA